MPFAAALDLPAWTALPFALLLLCIAVLPLVAGHWWHLNRNKGLVVLILAVPTAGYLLAVGPEGRDALLHELGEYFSFIVLLLALYVISGGIVLRGDLQGTPSTNLAFLAAGGLLANLIGTTGASMILIRPVLRINVERKNTSHIPVFFIFAVSNLGGLLTPLGDPPLFLGFLKGVDFFWTLRLWPQWLVANGMVLAIFYAWDRIAYRRERPENLRRDVVRIHPLRVAGLGVNGPLLALVILAVLFQSPTVGTAFGPDLTLKRPWGEIVMFAAILLSLTLSPKHHYKENRFAWGPILEVAILFLGLFAVMAPALALVQKQGPKLGLAEPWEYFWLTGVLSAFLDNAPTYVTFATLAADSDHFAALAESAPRILAAISCGAVFMGACTYIGNGPNFMVKAIAEEAGYPMPSFFAFVVKYSLPVLVPVFLVVTVVFFR